MNKKTLMLAGLLVIATVATAHGHAGGLDSNGGHTNKKTGEYHYHRKKPDPPPASTPSSTQAATVTAPTSSPPATMAEMRDRLFECREVQDSLARLSCFETLTNSLAAANAK